MVSAVDNSAGRQRLVVVGAGMAAHALLKRLVDRGALEHYAVTLVGDEPRPCYDRVNLTDCFFEKTPEELLLTPREWYSDHGVELRTDARVTSIDRERRTLATEAGEALSYDQLVLATGSRPFVPPMEGVDLPGVFVYRTIEDVHQIRDYAATCRNAAVLGGGLLGLEAGKALHDLGVETLVADVAPSLMPRQLNAPAGELLKEEVEKLGVTVRLLSRAQQIERNGRLTLVFDADDRVEVDMIVISSGIRPRDELARDAELGVGPRGGIAVDRAMRTVDPRIYAIGECASIDGELFGLVGPCHEMAEAVAENLADAASGKAMSAEFAGDWTGTRLKLMGVDVATLGLPIEESEGARAVVSRGEGFCRTLLVKDRRLVGAIGVGEWPERELLSAAIAERRRVTQGQQRRFVESGRLWPGVERAAVATWPAKATICGCMNVTRGELSAALAAGAVGADGLAEATGASTVCGSCRNLVCELAGQAGIAEPPKGRRGLLVGSGLAIALIVGALAAGPMPSADTVQSAWREIDALWRDSIAKQITGYTLLAISILALGLSLRKRVSWIRLGEFGTWRGAHGLLGAATLVGFVVHTGMRLGHNFTFALAATFLTLNLLGAFTGITASLESNSAGAMGRRLRAWRPRLTQLHIWLFWPFPVLVLFHIISVYYY